jgi:hypothetical protein
MDNFKFQYEGLKWLFEHQLLDNPQLINQLKMNILMVSPSVKDTELLIARDQKQMLVYVDLTWFGRTFRKTMIRQETEDILSQMLPSFKIRVVNDRKIFSMALEKVKSALTGGSNAIPNNSVAVSDTNKLASRSAAATDGATPSGEPAAAQADSEKQSKD